jgi:hypothetical protein
MRRSAAVGLSPLFSFNGNLGQRIKTAGRWVAALCLLLAAASPPASAQAPGVLIRHDNWMGQLFDEKPETMDQTLAHFIFPGGHDSGTYDLTDVVACDGCAVDLNNLLRSCQQETNPIFRDICDDEVVPNILGMTKRFGDAQRLTIRQQLDAGARYFDLRLFRATAADTARTFGRLIAGKYYIYHSLTGPGSAVVLDDIAGFLAQAGHEREVVILEFSGMKEGSGEMGDAALVTFFEQVRASVGNEMAPRKVDACAGDSACLPTQRFGAAATIREVLGQGHRLIVTCDCDTVAPDLWDPIVGHSPFWFRRDYPKPDSTTNPWRSDRELFQILDQASEYRDSSSRDEMFALGVQLGVDSAGAMVLRSVVCGALDLINGTGACPAVNNDWDQFASLRDVADYTNPKAIPALVGLPRHRLNIVYGDHYSREFTDEIYKLNRGAARMEMSIWSVTEVGQHDVGSDPDYYPVFFYPGATPIAWQFVTQRSIHEPDTKAIRRPCPRAGRRGSLTPTTGALRRSASRSGTPTRWAPTMRRTSTSSCRTNRPLRSSPRSRFRSA